MRMRVTVTLHHAPSGVASIRVVCGCGGITGWPVVLLDSLDPEEGSGDGRIVHAATYREKKAPPFVSAAVRAWNTERTARPEAPIEETVVEFDAVCPRAVSVAEDRSARTG